MDYLVYRHGSNAANQSMTNVMAVAIVENAPDTASAVEHAGEKINCYNNQYLSAVSVAECDSDDWNAIVDQSAENIACGYESIIFDYMD